MSISYTELAKNEESAEADTLSEVKGNECTDEEGWTGSAKHYRKAIDEKS